MSIALQLVVFEIAVSATLGIVVALVAVYLWVKFILWLIIPLSKKCIKFETFQSSKRYMPLEPVMFNGLKMYVVDQHEAVKDLEGNTILRTTLGKSITHKKEDPYIEVRSPTTQPELFTKE